MSFLCDVSIFGSDTSQRWKKEWEGSSRLFLEKNSFSKMKKP